MGKMEKHPLKGGEISIALLEYRVGYRVVKGGSGSELCELYPSEFST